MLPTANRATLLFYEYPGAEDAWGYVKNGVVFTGRYLYGPHWTLAVGDSGERLGWFRVSETYALPDSVSFVQQYGDSFLTFGEAIGEDPLDFNRAFDKQMWACLYSYPGSGEVVHRIGRSDLLASRSPEEEYTQFYRDSAGRLWFPFSSRLHLPSPLYRGWICLSDPGNAALPADPSITLPLPNVIPSADRIPFVFHLTDWHILAAIAALIAVVIVVRRIQIRRTIQKALASSPAAHKKGACP